MCCQRGWRSHRGSRTARRFAPGFRSAARAARRPRSGRGWGRGTRLPTAPGSGIGTPLRAVGALRRVPIRLCQFVKGGVPPFTLSPRSRGRRTRRFAAISFCAQSDAPTHRKGSAYGERRCSHRHRSRNAGETAYGRCTPSAAGQGNADLRPVLPVGAGNLPRRGETCHAHRAGGCCAQDPALTTGSPQHPGTPFA